MHRRFLPILILFVIGIFIYQATIPVLEGNDEMVHYNYFTWLRMTHVLPDRSEYLTNWTAQESGQPPLTYWVAAAVADLLRLPRYDGDTRTLANTRNLWSMPLEVARQQDNQNMYYHGRNEEAFLYPDVITNNRVQRIISALYGLLALIGAYGAARELLADHPVWALVAVAIFALSPQLLSMSATFSNDVSGVAFATLLTWQSLRVLRVGTSRSRLIMMGLLVGLAGLAKINAFIVLPGVVLALIDDWRERNRPFRQFIANILWIALPAAALLGPWIVYGIQTYADPLGLRTHGEYTAMTPSDAGEALRVLFETLKNYWGTFSFASHLHMNDLVYLALNLPWIAALLGYARAFHTRSRLPLLQRRQLLVLAAIVLAALASLSYWLVTLFEVHGAITGRLIYPAHSALTLLLTYGLYLATRRLRIGYAVQVYPIGLIAAAGLIYGPLAIYRGFELPIMLSPAQLPPLLGSPIDFDHTIRLLGYRQDSILHPNSFHAITLCWQVLRLPTRPGAFSIKIFDASGSTIAGERTSVHGLGRYNTSSWRVGDTFCDPVDVKIGPDLPAAHRYNVVVVMLDAVTQRADWKATTPDNRLINLPVLQPVVSAAGDMSRSIAEDWRPAAIAFPGFARLQGFALDRVLEPDRQVHLKLLWDVTGRTDSNWAMFIHLAGPESEVGLADGLPRGGQYPTWAWSPGEKIVDDWTLSLPRDLTPGDYSIVLGFYRQDTGERLAVTNDGMALDNRAAPLLTFAVH